MSRDSTVKLLEALKGAKIKRVADLRNAEIATALTEVVAKVYTQGERKREGLRRGGIYIRFCQVLVAESRKRAVS